MAAGSSSMAESLRPTTPASVSTVPPRFKPWRQTSALARCQRLAATRLTPFGSRSRATPGAWPASASAATSVRASTMPYRPRRASSLAGAPTTFRAARSNWPRPTRSALPARFGSGPGPRSTRPCSVRSPSVASHSPLGSIPQAVARPACSTPPASTSRSLRSGSTLPARSTTTLMFSRTTPR